MSLASKDRNLLDGDHFLGTWVCYSSCVTLLCTNYTPSGTEALVPAAAVSMAADGLLPEFLSGNCPPWKRAASPKVKSTSDD